MKKSKQFLLIIVLVIFYVGGLLPHMVCAEQPIFDPKKRPLGDEKEMFPLEQFQPVRDTYQPLQPSVQKSSQENGIVSQTQPQESENWLISAFNAIGSFFSNIWNSIFSSDTASREQEYQQAVQDYHVKYPHPVEQLGPQDQKPVVQELPDPVRFIFPQTSSPALVQWCQQLHRQAKQVFPQVPEVNAQHSYMLEYIEGGVRVSVYAPVNPQSGKKEWTLLGILRTHNVSVQKSAVLSEKDRQRAEVLTMLAQNKPWSEVEAFLKTVSPQDTSSGTAHQGSPGSGTSQYPVTICAEEMGAYRDIKIEIIPPAESDPTRQSSQDTISFSKTTLTLQAGMAGDPLHQDNRPNPQMPQIDPERSFFTSAALEYLFGDNVGILSQKAVVAGKVSVSYTFAQLVGERILPNGKKIIQVQNYDLASASGAIGISFKVPGTDLVISPVLGAGVSLPVGTGWNDPSQNEWLLQSVKSMVQSGVQVQWDKVSALCLLTFEPHRLDDRFGRTSQVFSKIHGEIVVGQDHKSVGELSDPTSASTMMGSMKPKTGFKVQGTITNPLDPAKRTTVLRAEAGIGPVEVSATSHLETPQGKPGYPIVLTAKLTIPVSMPDPKAIMQGDSTMSYTMIGASGKATLNNPKPDTYSADLTLTHGRVALTKEGETSSIFMTSLGPTLGYDPEKGGLIPGVQGNVFWQPFGDTVQLTAGGSAEFYREQAPQWKLMAGFEVWPVREPGKGKIGARFQTLQTSEEYPGNSLPFVLSNLPNMSGFSDPTCEMLSWVEALQRAQASTQQTQGTK